MSDLGFEPRFPRPQRGVLTTRRNRHLSNSLRRSLEFKGDERSSMDRGLSRIISIAPGKVFCLINARKGRMLAWKIKINVVVGVQQMSLKFKSFYSKI